MAALDRFACLSAGSAFCPQCGSLLVLPEANPITCDTCGFQTRFEELEGLEAVTVGKTRDVPEWLQASEAHGSAKETSQRRHRATVDEPCPKCNHPQLEFYTMQMRSADEGQTVFYECPNCGHNFSQNN